MADKKLKDEFFKLTRMLYIAQAKWFLNGFWKEGLSEEGENVWKYTHKFIELDKRKKEGNELDEFEAHKFLESLGETLTIIQLREKLRQIDLDANGKMALLEYLCFKYKKTVPQVIDSPQGDNQEEIDEAQAKLQAVQDALDDVQRKRDQAKQAVLDLQRSEEESRRREEEVKRQEALVRQAESELQAAVDDLKVQEQAKKNRIDDLTRKSQDSMSSAFSMAWKKKFAALGTNPES